MTIKRYPPRNTRKPRSGTYTRDAKKIRDAARVDPTAVCCLCNKPFTLADPPVADHVLPRMHGGSDHISNLRAAHRSCNGRRGQELGQTFFI